MDGENLIFPAGDIGGANVRLALVSPGNGPRDLLIEQEFHSADFKALAPGVETFPATAKARPTSACFCVAGPVINGRAHLTHLPWELEEGAVGEAIGVADVILIDDLKAIGHAVPHLKPEETVVINAGEAIATAPIAIPAPGTGLGESFLIWDGHAYIACASEGGQADFAPTNRLQADLWAFLTARFRRVAFDRVWSGSGLPDVYDFLKSRSSTSEKPGFTETLQRATDPTPLIVGAGIQDPGRNPLAARTMRLFIDVLGAEAANLALKVLATGGVWLAGGMPPRLVPQFTDGAVMRAFTGKGPFCRALTRHAGPCGHHQRGPSRSDALRAGRVESGVRSSLSVRSPAPAADMRQNEAVLSAWTLSRSISARGRLARRHREGRRWSGRRSPGQRHAGKGVAQDVRRDALEMRVGAEPVEHAPRRR